MRITESQLRRIIRQEVQSLREDGRSSGFPSSEVRTFFSDGGQSNEEFSTPDELLSLLLASQSGYPSVTLVVPDPDSYGEPDLIEVGSISFESHDAPPPGWERMWWWPLPVEYARPDPESARAPRYHSMLDAAAVSLQERLGESLHIFGAGAGLPQVKIQVREVWEDTTYLRAGFSREWWNGFVKGLRPKRAPVKWLGSDDQMVR